MQNVIDSDDDAGEKKGHREDGHFDRGHFLAVYVNSLNGGATLLVLSSRRQTELHIQIQIQI